MSRLSSVRKAAMDLWDLTKVMFRRWYLTLPLIAVTAAAAVWTVQVRGPDYEATGHVAVLPPTVQRVAAPGETTLRVSPWTQQALAEAARIRLEGGRLRDTLAREGYRGEWTVEVTGEVPVITLVVIAPSAQSARATLHRLEDEIDREVESLQGAYGVPPAERIQSVRYEAGESVSTSASSLRRAVVAAVAAGLGLTVPGAGARDGLLRRRRRRREYATAAVAAVVATPSAVAGPTGGDRGGVDAPAAAPVTGTPPLGGTAIRSGPDADHPDADHRQPDRPTLDRPD